MIHASPLDIIIGVLCVVQIIILITALFIAPGEYDDKRREKRDRRRQQRSQARQWWSGQLNEDRDDGSH